MNVNFDVGAFMKRDEMSAQESDESSESKIGLALGSGGARGWAHIGALLELEQLGIRPHCIVGTSIGAIAGVVYATGNTRIAQEVATDLNWTETAKLFLELNTQRSGLLTGRNFIKLLKKIIPARTFEALQIPMAIVATALEDESEVIFKEGNLFEALRASIGIPGIFTPIYKDGSNLVDGGLKNPLPINICREMGATKVIAIDVNLGKSINRERTKATHSSTSKSRAENNNGELKQLTDSIISLIPQGQTTFSKTVTRWFEAQKKSREQTLSLFDVLTRSFRLIENEITRSTLKLNPPEILIQPSVGDIMTLEFHRGPEAIEAGRAAVHEQRSQLQRLSDARATDKHEK